jgi:hypothetical protein
MLLMFETSSLKYFEKQINIYHRINFMTKWKNKSLFKMLTIQFVISNVNLEK